MLAPTFFILSYLILSFLVLTVGQYHEYREYDIRRNLGCRRHDVIISTCIPGGIFGRWHHSASLPASSLPHRLKASTPEYHFILISRALSILPSIISFRNISMWTTCMKCVSNCKTIRQLAIQFISYSLNRAFSISLTFCKSYHTLYLLSLHIVMFRVLSTDLHIWLKYCKLIYVETSWLGSIQHVSNTVKGIVSTFFLSAFFSFFEMCILCVLTPVISCANNNMICLKLIYLVWDRSLSQIWPITFWANERAHYKCLISLAETMFVVVFVRIIFHGGICDFRVIFFSLWFNELKTSTPIHARAWKEKALAGYNSQQIPTNNNIHKMLIIII